MKSKIRSIILHRLVPLVAGLTLVGGLSANSPAQEKAMHKAVCARSLSKVKSLIRNGYNINRVGKKTTPLSLACYCYGGASRIANYLIDQGASPNAHQPKGYSPLMWALRSQKSTRPNDRFRKIAIRLIRKGARVNHQTKTTGRTALMLAASRGDIKIMQMLLNRGAKRSPKANRGWDPGTAADYARRGGHVELALWLEHKSTAEYKRGLHFAVKSGDESRVRSLLQNGANVNEAERISKYTPLHYAGMHNRVKIAGILIKAGAGSSPVSYAGITPLRDAVVYYRSDLARTLIDNGARADNTQSQGCGGGMTEFDWAVSYRQYKLVKYMVNKGAADIKKINAFRSLWGYNKREIELAEFLISKGAKPSQDRISRLKGMKQSKVRRQLVALYENALRKPPTNDFPPIPLAVKFRAMPETQANKDYNQQFRGRKGGMRSEQMKVPNQ